MKTRDLPSESTTTTVADEVFLRNIADRWITAWNSHGTEQVLALPHPDIVWHDTVFWRRSCAAEVRSRSTPTASGSR